MAAKSKAKAKAKGKAPAAKVVKSTPNGAEAVKKHPSPGAAAASRPPVVKQTIVSPTQPPSGQPRPVPAAVRVAETVEDVVTRPSARPVSSARPAPAQPLGGNWLNRLLGRWPQRRADTGMPEHLAAVKAGVLHELENMGAEKGMALQGGPFRNVVLPRRRKPRRWLWPVAGVLAAVLVLAMLWAGRPPAGPARVLAQAMAAVASHDVDAFETRVDTAGLASSAVNQLFSVPRIDPAGLPPELRVRMLQSGNDVAARMNAFIKPGLAEGLRDDILAAVAAGVVPADERSVLKRIWADLGGAALTPGAPRLAMQDERLAVVEVPLTRTDLGVTLPLQVVVTHGADGRWMVSDIPNLAVVMDGMARAVAGRQQQVAITPAAAASRRALTAVSARGVRSAKAPGGGLLLTMTVDNGGTADVAGPQLKVVFADAAGQPLKTALVTLDGVLKAGASREQTWTIPIDRSHGAERFVADLPLSALQVQVGVVGGLSQ